MITIMTIVVMNGRRGENLFEYLLAEPPVYGCGTPAWMVLQLRPSRTRASGMFPCMVGSIHTLVTAILLRK